MKAPGGKQRGARRMVKGEQVTEGICDIIKKKKKGGRKGREEEENTAKEEKRQEEASP